MNIETPWANIQIKGTSFTLRVNETFGEIKLHEGSVVVKHKFKNSQRKVKKNEALKFAKSYFLFQKLNTKTPIKRKITNRKISELVTLKNGYELSGQVISSNRYKIKIRLINNRIKAISFSFKTIL